MLASVSGYQMFQASQFWLVYRLEGSPLYLGYVGLANAIPAIALNLFGGVFADKVDKRRLIVVSHGVAGRLLRGAYAGLSQAETLAQDIPQDAVYRLTAGQIDRFDCAPIAEPA